jgi:hypothetical protein
MVVMANWQKSFTREPPKTKAELREMLAEAVRNTQPETKRQSKSKSDRG